MVMNGYKIKESGIYQGVCEAGMPPLSPLFLIWLWNLLQLQLEQIRQ